METLVAIQPPCHFMLELLCLILNILNQLNSRCSVLALQPKSSFTRFLNSLFRSCLNLICVYLDSNLHSVESTFNQWPVKGVDSTPGVLHVADKGAKRHLCPCSFILWKASSRRRTVRQHLVGCEMLDNPRLHRILPYIL